MRLRLRRRMLKVCALVVALSFFFPFLHYKLYKMFYMGHSDRAIFRKPTLSIKEDNIPIYIASVFMDQSKTGEFGGKYLILLAYVPDYKNFQFIHQNTYCRLLSREKRHMLCPLKAANVTILNSSQSKDGKRSHEVILTCHLDDGTLDTKLKYELVSLSLHHACTEQSISNTARIIYTQHKTNVSSPMLATATFSVCLVVPTFLTLLQQRLEHFVEFIEINKILGARRIYLSTVQELPGGWLQNIGLRKHYKSLLEVQHHTDLRNFGKCEDCKQLLANDCLYRNRHSHKYVFLAQELEILFPRLQNTQSWSQMVKAIEHFHSIEIGALSFQALVLFDESSNSTSSYSWLNQSKTLMLPRIVTHRLRKRVVNSKDLASGLLLKPDRVIYVTANNIARLVPGYSTLSVPVNYGAVYKFSLSKHKFNRTEHIIDSSMDKFVPKLLQAMHRDFY